MLKTVETRPLQRNNGEPGPCVIYIAHQGALDRATKRIFSRFWVFIISPMRLTVSLESDLTKLQMGPIAIGLNFKDPCRCTIHIFFLTIPQQFEDLF